jgi:hypothetical protein
MIQNSFELFLQICIPALKLTNEDMMLFDEQAVEFVNASTDMCTERESDNIKNHAAKLLLSLNKNVDGMQTFMIDFCLGMIDNITKKSD